jgi:hypothetical protein
MTFDFRRSALLNLLGVSAVVAGYCRLASLPRDNRTPAAVRSMPRPPFQNQCGFSRRDRDQRANSELGPPGAVTFCPSATAVIGPDGVSVQSLLRLLVICCRI